MVIGRQQKEDGSSGCGIEMKAVDRDKWRKFSKHRGPFASFVQPWAAEIAGVDCPKRT